MANSGIVIVTELRKLVDGIQTKDVKPNLKGDSDYIPPYTDTSKCVLNADPVSTTTTIAPTTTTTTVFSYKSFALSDQSYTDTPYACGHTGGFDTAYHNGSSTYPEVGDEVYVDSAGNTDYNQGVYLLDTADKTITISQGTVTLKTNCTTPAPVTTSTTTTTQAPTTNHFYLKYCSDDTDVYCGGYRQTLSDNTSTWSIGNTFYNTCINACTYLSATAPQGSQGGNIDGSTVTRYNSCAGCSPPTTADYSCGDGYQSQETLNMSAGNYPSVSVSSSDPSSNTFYWEALDRPNRFNVYENGDLVDSSGWVGQANYYGPWGSSLSTASSGFFHFNWTEGSTNREVRVEFAAADPSNQIGDGARWQIQCVAAPTTSAPTTSAPAPDLWLLQGCDVGQGNQTIPYDPDLDPGVVILCSDNQCYTVISTQSGTPTLTWVTEFTECQECLDRDGGV